MGKLILLLLVTGVLLLGGCTPKAETLEPPPELYDKVWISPAAVEVGNFFPGARAEPDQKDWLTIHNGNDQPTKFSVTYRATVNVTEGFVTAPKEAQGWVIIADPTPVLAAKETRQVLVALEMPEGATAPSKWEFQIVVKDETQTGLVQTELACRWLVTMRK